MSVPPKTFKAKLKAKILLAEDTYDFIFTSEEPLQFAAGQFLYVTVTDGQQPPLNRAYSICSAPHQSEIKLCIKIVAGGRATNWFLTLEEGAEIECLAPLGHFTFKNDSPREALLIATGTGIAPLNSMIEEQLHNGDQRKLTLIFGLRHISHLFYEEHFAALKTKYPNFEYFYTLSKPENESWQGEIGRVTEWLNKNFDQRFEKTALDTYICGLGDMVQDVQKLLAEKGVPKENVHFERYS